MGRKDQIVKEHLELIKRLVSEAKTSKKAKEKEEPSEASAALTSIIKQFADNSNTKEEDHLPFIEKYALVGESGEWFVKDMGYLYLKFKNEGKSVEQIISILAPRLKGVSDFSHFLKALDKHYEGGGPGEADKILFRAASDSNDYILNSKRSFTKGKKDEKSAIGYRFDANLNLSKLNPHGFWQLQFLARLVSGKPSPKFPEEEVFFYGKGREMYQSRAYRMLQNFYTKAFTPIAYRISGRDILSHGDERFNRDQGAYDEDFHENIKTRIEGAVSHMLHQLSENKYDENYQNIGSWAFTVMANHVKDYIKSVTSMKLRSGQDLKSGIDIYHVFETGNLVTWTSENSDAAVPDGALAVPVEESKEKQGFYVYVFKTPLDAYTHFEEAVQGMRNNLFNQLDQKGKSLLKNIGALKSVPRDVLGLGATSEEQPEIDAKPKPAQENYRRKLLVALANVVGKFQKITLPSASKEGSFETQKKVAEEQGLTDEQLDDAYKEAIGEIIFLRWTHYIQDTVVWKSKPDPKFFEALRTTHNLDPVELAAKVKAIKTESDVMGRFDVKKGKQILKQSPIVDKIFFNPKTKDVYMELSPYIEYRDTSRNNREVIDGIIHDYNSRQNEKLERGELGFPDTADKRGNYPEFTKVRDAINSVMSARKTGEVKNISRLSGIISKLTGADVQFENKQPIYNKPIGMKKHNIKKFLSESLHKALSTLLNEDSTSLAIEYGLSPENIAQANNMAEEMKQKGKNSRYTYSWGDNEKKTNMLNYAIEKAVEDYANADDDEKTRIADAVSVVYSPSDPKLISAMKRHFSNRKTGAGKVPEHVLKDYISEVWVDRLGANTKDRIETFLSRGYYNFAQITYSDIKKKIMDHLRKAATQKRGSGTLSLDAPSDGDSNVTLGQKLSGMGDDSDGNYDDAEWGDKPEGQGISDMGSSGNEFGGLTIQEFQEAGWEIVRELEGMGKQFAADLYKELLIYFNSYEEAAEALELKDGKAVKEKFKDMFKSGSRLGGPGKVAERILQKYGVSLLDIEMGWVSKGAGSISSDTEPSKDTLSVDVSDPEKAWADIETQSSRRKFGGMFESEQFQKELIERVAERIKNQLQQP